MTVNYVNEFDNRKINIIFGMENVRNTSCVYRLMMFSNEINNEWIIFFFYVINDNHLISIYTRKKNNSE